MSPKKLILSGPNTGLSIEMFAGIPTSIENLTQSGHLGLAVFVHHPATSPLNLVPVGVSTNQETNLMVMRVENRKQPTPYSECVDIDSVKSDIKDVVIAHGIHTSIDVFKEPYINVYINKKRICV